MASSINGIFPGQQPPGAHPVGVPPGPAQPSFPGTVPRVQGSNTLVDELEASFEVGGKRARLALLLAALALAVVANIGRKYILLQAIKRLQLSVQKPEQVLKEDVSDLRNELQRKELLVQKHLAKLHHWQQILEDVSGQHRKPTDLPPPGPLTFLEQASASLPPAPLKPS
ncbi:hypothetical protein XENOCAPTIV_029560 [Xenoophorus captivus]|uniref:Mediator of RNA polymerase II transcription subunit 28 n=1 Tax=Xenoophorus captivus TaxID=1517983 RepID=A0ABV0RVP3_9TELE